MKAEVSTQVDRPVSVVWDFYAVQHVQNHPRWDPDIHLEATSDRPIGVGTIIRRRNTRSGNPVEGTMEVLEFVTDDVMAVRTQDGPMEILGRATLTPLREDRTRLSLSAEFVGMDDSMADKIVPLMQRSAETIKRLIESER